MKIVDWNPSEGMAFQGDVAIVAVPSELAGKLTRHEEISARDNRLILAEGEVTGHHHEIYLLRNIPKYHDTALSADVKVDAKMKKFLPQQGKAKLFRCNELASAMQGAGVLTRTDLTVGFLEVTEAPVEIRHQEHDAIRVPEGLYYVGRQIESVGAEERRVAD
jgi:hypothetical protein